jgi:uncharacterized protein (TIGR04255 family)
MLRDLPEPRHELLPQAPVALVVWQLQFAGAADVVPPAVGASLADRLARDGGGPFQLQRLTTQTFAIAFPPPQVAGQPVHQGQAVPQAEQAQIEGWALQRGPVAVTVNRQALTIETNVYETWSSFRAVIENALEALGEGVLLPGEQRLGLRYVDRIVRPGVRKLEDWSGQLAPWLIGPLTHPHLRDEVAAYAQQVDFDAQPDGLRATLRQRAFPDVEQRGRQTVILDFDVFRDGYRLIETDATLAATNQMNELAHRLFEASITESLRAAFATESEEA